jgi:hypothetical protein
VEKTPYYDDLTEEEKYELAKTFSDVETFRKTYFNYENIIGDHYVETVFQGNSNENIESTEEGEPVLKIKFVITDVKSRPNKHVRKYTSKLLKGIHKEPKYGIYHSSIVRTLMFRSTDILQCVGPQLLEWSKSSLCVIRPCASSSAILAMDVAIFKGEACIRDLLQEISSIVVEVSQLFLFSNL